MARKEDSKSTRRVHSSMTRTARDEFDFPRNPKNILWYLNHKFLFRGKGIVRLHTWDELLKRYVSDPKNGIPQTPEARTSARGNATAQIFTEDESMTVSNFVKAAVIAGASNLKFMVVWEFPDGSRIVGSVPYSLTPDMLVRLSEENEEIDLIAQVSAFLQNHEDTSSTPLKKLWRKLVGYRTKKKDGENNA